MLVGSSRELFAAIAECAAALTGLLFVAISVAPRRSQESGQAVIQQVRAAASLLAFTNALSVSLFGLVPNNGVGYPAISLAVIGILFTAAAARSIFASPAVQHLRRRQLGLIILLLLACGVELAAGIDLILNPQDSFPRDMISNVLVALLLIGIARAWELVGDRDTGIVASIAVLAGRPPPRILSADLLPGLPAPAEPPAPTEPPAPAPTATADVDVTDDAAGHQP